MSSSTYALFWQTSLTIKGSSSVPVMKDHQIAINQWFEIRRSQQRLIKVNFANSKNPGEYTNQSINQSIEVSYVKESGMSFRSVMTAWFGVVINMCNVYHLFDRQDKDKQLIGQSVQVYWKDGASSRWYSACLKGFNAKDQTVTVMDYNVIQDRKVDPRLEEIQVFICIFSE